MAVVSTPHQTMPRATRFPMNLPVRYRVHGDEGWSYGMTLNISSTGLLFRSGRGLNPHAAMEIEVVLPGDSKGTPRVISRGLVIRVAATNDAARDHLIAATLDASELIRTPRGGVN